MDKTLVVDFYKVFAGVTTAEEIQLVNELLAVWGKLEKSPAKNPAMFRRGIVFGLSLQKAIAAGDIILRPVRLKKQKTSQKEMKSSEEAESNRRSDIF